MKKALILGLIFTLSFQACKKPLPLWEKNSIELGDSFHDIEALDDKVAVAYSYGSGLIIKTIDRGKSWKVVHRTDSIYFEQIEFPTKEIGYICGNSNNILMTENSGEEWTEISLDSLPATASIYGMKFIDTAKGYFAMLKSTENGYGSDIYHTEDAGQNWTYVHFIPEMILNIELVDDELWASGHNVVLKNIDRDWQIVYKDTAREVGQIRDFVFLEEKLIMASFNGYIILKAGDQITKNKITENRLRSIVSIPGERIIAAGDHNKEKGNMFESFDNGKTWKAIDFIVPDIHRLIYKNGTVWGVGKQDTFITIEF